VVREWKYWTRNKLEILAGYLPAFNIAAQKKSPERLYIDLMAGDPVNRDRDTHEEFDGSARLALQATPAFTKVALCEKEPGKAEALRADLAERFPGDSRYHVYEGDCNVIIDQVLHHLRQWRWAPTFAFVDQQGAEAHWATLEKLAAFRTGVWKTEIWILISPAMITKGVHGTAGDEFMDRVDLLFGTTDWRRIQAARDRGVISAAGYRDEMVNLLRWRLQTTLRYAMTERIPMRMLTGMAIYDMVFATDHWAGQRIMTDLYRSAAKREPGMMAEARQNLRERKRENLGQGVLFEAAPLSDDEVAESLEWTSIEPWDPTSRPWW
jgi:three-Cys-motif partner protein